VLPLARLGPVSGQRATRGRCAKRPPRRAFGTDALETPRRSLRRRAPRARAARSLCAPRASALGKTSSTPTPPARRRGPPPGTSRPLLDPSTASQPGTAATWSWAGWGAPGSPHPRAAAPSDHGEQPRPQRATCGAVPERRDPASTLGLERQCATPWLNGPLAGPRRRSEPPRGGAQSRLAPGPPRTARPFLRLPAARAQPYRAFQRCSRR
jgi:hypothetical protein